MCTVRVRVKNRGTETWHRDSPEGHFTGLALFMNGENKAVGRLIRPSVCPGEMAFIPITFTVPENSGRYVIKLDMFSHNVTMFEQQGNPPLEMEIDVISREKTTSEKIWDMAAKHNYWFFSPSLGVHLSQDGPAYPLFANSAKGSRITDTEGREYIDLVMGWGCSLLGYADERIKAAIAGALSSGGIITLTHRLEIDVSERLCSMFPGAEMVLFGKNGSDVCTAAVRMARSYTHRRKILVCGYHGWQDWYAEQMGFEASGVPGREEGLVIAFPYGDMDAFKRLVDSHSGDVAAVMMDPSAPVTDLNGPWQEVDTAYLENIASITRREGAVLIFDEVLSGFRYMQGSVQKAHGVVADLTCLGKALSAGMPLSALIGRRDIFVHTLHRISYTPTFKGEVYSFAAAHAALKIYQTEDIPGRVWSFGNKLKAVLNDLCTTMKLPAKVIGPPFRMAVSFDEQDCERGIMMRTLLVQELAKNGVIVWKGLMLPSYAHDGDDLDAIAAAFEKSFSVLSRALRDDALLKYLEIPDNP